MSKGIEFYDGGRLALYEDRPVHNSFGAKINEEDLELMFEDIPFKEMSYRRSDVEFASSEGFSLSRKVKVQYCRILQRNKKYKVMIDNALYDVASFDMTFDAAYLYLEYIREVEDER